MTEHLPDVELTDDQMERSLVVYNEICGDGQALAARLIVHLRDRVAELEHKIETCGLQCSATMKSLVAEIERLRTALAGVQSCSTCEACRGAATRALGAGEKELRRLEFAPPTDPGPSEADHPRNDWECKSCAWMNFGSRTRCGNCEAARPAQPTVEGALRELRQRLGLTETTRDAPK